MVKTNRGVVPVIHSTGNFVSGQPSLPRQTSMIARLELCQNDKTKLGAWSKHGQVVVGEAGWTAARMQRTTTRTLKMALNPASSDYTKKSLDLIENLVPGCIKTQVLVPLKKSLARGGQGTISPSQRDN